MQPSNTQVNCPNCRQAITADVQQLFDMNVDPTAKQRLLSGAVNIIRCPFCGYQGALGTPIVYHDPEKELLMTFMPVELGLPRDEQERVLGSLINQVVNRLPQEKRKGYLFSPETVLTQERLMERILEEDGITSEMIQAQQERLSLLQRLMNSTEDARAEIVNQEEHLLDGEFFTLLGRLVEASTMSGDRESAERLRALQQEILPQTAFGQEMQQQVHEIEAAIQSLQEAGEELTRERLLELVIQAPNDARLRALVSLTRPAIDYTFFQDLSERIDRSQGDEKETLTALRERLLELTREIDQQVEARMAQARQLLNGLLRSENVQEATLQNLPAIDEFFVDVLNAEIEAARGKGDKEKLGKLERIVATLQEASAPPPEIEFIQELLEASDDEALGQLIDSRSDQITPELLDTLAAMINQAQSSGDEQLSEKLRAINRKAVRHSMQAKLKQD